MYSVSIIAFLLRVLQCLYTPAMTQLCQTSTLNGVGSRPTLDNIVSVASNSPKAYLPSKKLSCKNACAKFLHKASKLIYSLNRSVVNMLLESCLKIHNTYKHYYIYYPSILDIFLSYHATCFSDGLGSLIAMKVQHQANSAKQDSIRHYYIVT